MHRKETSMKKVLKIADAIMIILIIPVLMKNILTKTPLQYIKRMERIYLLKEN